MKVTQITVVLFLLSQNIKIKHQNSMIYSADELLEASATSIWLIVSAAKFQKQGIY